MPRPARLRAVVVGAVLSGSLVVSGVVVGAALLLGAGVRAGATVPLALTTSGSLAHRAQPVHNDLTRWHRPSAANGVHANGVHYAQQRPVSADRVVTLRIPGFAPHARVQLRLAGSTEPLGVARATAAGVVRTNETLPRDLAPGRHSLILMSAPATGQHARAAGNVGVTVPSVAFLDFVVDRTSVRSTS